METIFLLFMLLGGGYSAADEIVGIGVKLYNPNNDVVVQELVPGGPAAKSGLLKVNDTIIGVGQEDRPIDEMKRLPEVTQNLKGKVGTKVRVRVLRKEGDKASTVEISLVRDKINWSGPTAKVIRHDERPWTGDYMWVAKGSLDILLTSPSGKRVGWSQKYNQQFKEYPQTGAFYTGRGTEPQTIMLYNPDPGKYSLTGVATKSGPYTITISRDTESKSKNIKETKGTGVAGQPIQPVELDLDFL